MKGIERKHSESVYRRRVLSDFRSSEKRIIDIEQAKKELGEIKNLVLSEELDHFEKASLQVEIIWLSERTGLIASNERGKMLGKLEKEDPEAYEWLSQENSNGLTRLAEIRDRVMPSVKGYHTKRF